MPKLQDLVAKFPLLYSPTFWFECGDGWYFLLEILSEQITTRIKKFPKRQQHDFTALQVKEKFGSLRFYIDGSSPEIDKYISEAEALSYVTCSDCGWDCSSVNDGRWGSGRCRTCKNKIELKICFKKYMGNYINIE